MPRVRIGRNQAAAFALEVDAARPVITKLILYRMFTLGDGLAWRRKTLGFNGVCAARGVFFAVTTLVSVWGKASGIRTFKASSRARNATDGVGIRRQLPRRLPPGSR